MSGETSDAIWRAAFFIMMFGPIVGLSVLIVLGQSRLDRSRRDKDGVQ